MRALTTTATANLGRPMPPRLSIDGNRFTLVDGSGNEKPLNTLQLDIVIIDLNDNVSKMYWGKDYNPNDTGDIPLCWSDNGQAPSVQAQSPQSPKCMTCKHNVIGSAISKFTGAKIKACVDMKKLAFVVPEGQVPGIPGDMVFLMTIKPGSFKNWTTYINFLKQQNLNGHTPELYEIVTRLEFESQGVLKFTPIAASQPYQQQYEAAYNKGTTPEIVGATDQPWSGQIAAPAQQQTLPPPVQPQVQQPAPLAQPAAPFVEAAPSSAGAFASAAVAPVESPRRKRRTKAEIEADNAAAAAASQPQPAPAPAFLSPQATGAAAPPAQPPAQAAAPFLSAVGAAPPSSPTTPGASTAATPSDGLEIPAFLKRDQPAPAAPAPNGGQFGLATPAAPDKQMQDALAAAFNLPT